MGINYEVKMAELNTVLCKQMWERYRTSEIEPDEEGKSKKFRVRELAKQDAPSGKASFLGYFDLTWRDDLGFCMKLRGLQAKVIKGRFYVDMPSELSDKLDANGKAIYFPHYLPKTAETRDVLTKLAHRDLRIQAQVIPAIARWEARQAGSSEAAPQATGAVEPGDESDDNPF
jgi:hypothetical protein